ncbi:MAG: PEP-CTERM sorting domain-containing protein [Pirellulaceae bacterium]|nr:PEP-CTERM sorting domain-containing protein [Pirellulaceae bacterium]
MLMSAVNRFWLLVLSVSFVHSTSISLNAGLVYVDQLYGYSVTTYQYTMGTTSSGSVPLLADVYQPVDIGLGAIPVNRPAIVLQDGGAWSSARRTAGRVTDPARYFAQRGYTVVITDYRQGAPAADHSNATVGNTIFGTQPYAGLTVPFLYSIFPGLKAVRAGIEDFAVAIDWTRTNAAMLGIDPDRIAAGGGSAGAINLLMLQYNNNPINSRYAAQAVISLVGSTYGNYNKIQAGGPPVFLLNNTADLVVPWEPQMLNRFLAVGIDTEMWYQPTDATYHNVEWDLDLGGLNLRERLRDFLARTVATPYMVPEPSSFALLLCAMTGLGYRHRRRAL